MYVISYRQDSLPPFTQSNRFGQEQKVMAFFDVLDTCDNLEDSMIICDNLLREMPNGGVLIQSINNDDWSDVLSEQYIIPRTRKLQEVLKW